jgi:dihydrofolate reductase
MIIISVPFDLLLSRPTYEILAVYWPFAEDSPTAKALNRATRYVVSSTLNDLQWHNSRLIQALPAHNLIDVFRLWISPVVIGKGKRLFKDGAVPAGLELADTRASTTGVMMNSYHRSGALQTGSLVLENTPAAEIERRQKIAREDNGWEFIQ